MRAQRAKAMKFGDGYMVSSGHPAKIYLEKAFTHVQMRQGSIGIKVHPFFKTLLLPLPPLAPLIPLHPIPPPFTLPAGVHHVAARPHRRQRREDAPARLHQDQRPSRCKEAVSVARSSCFAVKSAGSRPAPARHRARDASGACNAVVALCEQGTAVYYGAGAQARGGGRCERRHVRPSACAKENKKRSSAALGMVAAKACMPSEEGGCR